MKAAPFSYVRPGSVAEVLSELSQDGAKVIAGGQSLVPVLAMRLAQPTTLVDINAVDELHVLEKEPGGVRVGAAVRQRTAQRDSAIAEVPLLGMALPWIGHREIRSRGTICGSLAHADPAAELPAVAICLEATVTIASPKGTRTVDAVDFFTAAMTTTVQPEELITSVCFPRAAETQGFAFAEIARRHGDFALSGVAVRVDAKDRMRPSARITCFGISDTPRVRDVSEQLTAVLGSNGADAPEERLRTALAATAQELAADVVDTGGDEHGSQAYRRQLITALASRELARAYAKAVRASSHTDEEKA